MPAVWTSHKPCSTAAACGIARCFVGNAKVANFARRLGIVAGVERFAAAAVLALRLSMVRALFILRARVVWTTAPRACWHLATDRLARIRRRKFPDRIPDTFSIVALVVPHPRRAVLLAICLVNVLSTLLSNTLEGCAVAAVPVASRGIAFFGAVVKRRVVTASALDAHVLDVVAHEPSWRRRRWRRCSALCEAISCARELAIGVGDALVGDAVVLLLGMTACNRRVVFNLNVAFVVILAVVFFLYFCFVCFGTRTRVRVWCVRVNVCVNV